MTGEHWGRSGVDESLLKQQDEINQIESQQLDARIRYGTGRGGRRSWLRRLSLRFHDDPAGMILAIAAGVLIWAGIVIAGFTAWIGVKRVFFGGLQ